MKCERWHWVASQYQLSNYDLRRIYLPSSPPLLLPPGSRKEGPSSLWSAGDGANPILMGAGLSPLVVWLIPRCQWWVRSCSSPRSLRLPHHHTCLLPCLTLELLMGTVALCSPGRDIVGVPYRWMLPHPVPSLIGIHGRNGAQGIVTTWGHPLVRCWSGTFPRTILYRNLLPMSVRCSVMIKCRWWSCGGGPSQPSSSRHIWGTSVYSETWTSESDMFIWTFIMLPQQLMLLLSPLNILTVMEGKLRIATYNCLGIKSSEPYIRDILGQVYILALQETWLYAHEVHRLDNFHKDFVSFSTSAMEEFPGIGCGCLYGGFTF